ncbi:MAG TPA: AAA family ATPase, partial [Pseudobdellovibrionaceae bacterium]|nr:AAA family ATPase [Pseudobdellovibrionaceae bacterium]
MLVELKVNHFAIIDSIHLQFQKGLNILSGETGAGKSVLLKSLALLMGDKASADMIRTGESMAVVEGCFDLSDRPDVVEQLKALDISCDEPELIVRRIVAAHDRSKVYMNGSLCTLNMLRDVVAPLIEVAGHNAPLIEMTGQHDNKNLMARSYHLEFLDLYANCGELRDRYEKLWREWGAQKFQLEKLIQESQTHSQRIDYLEFQRNEITALELAPGEEFEIENNLKRLKNSSRIIQIIESIESALDTDTESALQRLRSAKRRYHELEQLDQTLQTQQGMHENIEQAESLLSDFLFSLRK